MLTFTVPGRPLSVKKEFLDKPLPKGSSIFQYQARIRTVALIAVRREHWKIPEVKPMRLEITIHCRDWGEVPNIIRISHCVGEAIKGIVIDKNWHSVVKDVEIGIVTDGRQELRVTVVEIPQNGQE